MKPDFAEMQDKFDMRIHGHSTGLIPEKQVRSGRTFS